MHQAFRDEFAVAELRRGAIAQRDKNLARSSVHQGGQGLAQVPGLGALPSLVEGVTLEARLAGIAMLGYPGGPAETIGREEFADAAQPLGKAVDAATQMYVGDVEAVAGVGFGRGEDPPEPVARSSAHHAAEQYLILRSDRLDGVVGATQHPRVLGRAAPKGPAAIGFV